VPVRFPNLPGSHPRSPAPIGIDAFSLAGFPTVKSSGACPAFGYGIPDSTMLVGASPIGSECELSLDARVLLLRLRLRFPDARNLEDHRVPILERNKDDLCM
jgi:hypothetical protein